MSSPAKVTPINTTLGMRICLSGIRQIFSSVPQLSTDEFYSRFCQPFVDRAPEKNVLLLDVRSCEERNISCIENSIHIDSEKPMVDNVQNVKNLIKEKLQTENFTCLNIIAYCSIGYRSSDLVKHLSLNYKEEGSSSLKFYNLDGSIFKWANEKKPIVTPENEPTIFVHPFNSVWGKLLHEPLRKWTN